MLALDKLRTRSRLTALALGGLTCSLAACGGSDSDKESTGGGMLQGSGSGSPTTGSGSPGRSNSGSLEEMDDCGVDGATVQLLSPTPGENVDSIGLAGGSVFYGLESGLYRVPVGDSAARAEKVADGRSVAYYPDGDRVGTIQTVDGALQLTWHPVAGGDPTSVTLPMAAEGRWGHDAVRNSFYAVTSLRPFSYLRYDLGSGQTEQFTTELMAGNNARISYTPSQVVVWFSAGLDNVDSLYRIEKGTSTAVKLEPGVDQFSTTGMDDETMYLDIGEDSGLREGIYRMPMDGSAPAVRADEFGAFTDLAYVVTTDQGTFGQKFNGYRFEVIPVGGPTAGVPVLSYNCDSASDIVVDADNFYVIVSPHEDYWLLTVPRP